MNEITPLDEKHWIMVGIAIILFIISTMIVPIKVG
jgi:hypothetical protein